MSDPGSLMRAEIAEAPAVFARTAAIVLDRAAISALDLPAARAFYTIARGSSDAAANILSYEFMRETGKPMTSLPPSVFSVGRGVDMSGSVALVVSQSGASEDLVRSAAGARAGWAEAAKLMRSRNDDRLLDPPVATRFDDIVWVAIS